jgi:hypothetical protein
VSKQEGVAEDEDVETALKEVRQRSISENEPYLQVEEDSSKYALVQYESPGLYLVDDWRCDPVRF